MCYPKICLVFVHLGFFRCCYDCAFLQHNYCCSRRFCRAKSYKSVTDFEGPVFDCIKLCLTIKILLLLLLRRCCLVWTHARSAPVSSMENKSFCDALDANFVRTRNVYAGQTRSTHFFSLGQAFLSLRELCEY